ncbi:alpha-glucoside ABC transporter substrate-binding protein [Meridianimarinicoccus roseus]|uniref:Alpha-glucoside ABC transporter substrate-binding protein n=1 Tax=Meridianimarinicoccus roseus TaxID=2072018 RepID=A0A2V2LBG4_9RHOB|nr:ABC transporter substrate-binding protein [Meridianimarinicoccus roseus]PWR01051.1 alpha-glucoside ABC transporter substrate-binding protein [Meridianimarinicoccus roseus]
MTNLARKTAIAGALAALCLPTQSAGQLLHQPGDGPFNWDAYDSFAAANDFSGQTLTVLGASTGVDKTRLEHVFAYFAEATGAEVAYSGSDSFEQDIVIALQAGSLPDVGMFPQPGLAMDIAARGGLSPMADGTRDWYETNFAAGASWADLASFPGPDGDTRVYGTIFGTDVKSLVWYAPEVFEELGYAVPETMEELKALTDRIVADGLVPFCLGLGAGAATGWPATDWVEDFMLRTQPLEVYDQWVNHEIPFDDPRVVAAIAEFGHFARNDAYLDGGVSGATTIDFRDSPNGLFEFPPRCVMHKQASFIPNFFPAGVEMGVDVDFFYFPAYAEKDLGRPVLGSGGLATVMADKPIAHAFMEYLQTPFAHEIFMSQGQILTPHLGANPDAYANDTQRKLGEILTSATSFRFDGSDLMPGEIGTDAFWSAMVDYVSGAASAAEAAAAIEARWNEIR